MGKAFQEAESEYLLHKANDPETAGDTRGDWSKLTVACSVSYEGWQVFVFCDIHGHSRKKNAFMYGCESRIRQGQQFHECILPKMLSQKAEIFSYDDCSFVVPKSKEGCGRVVVGAGLRALQLLDDCGLSGGEGTRHLIRLYAGGKLLWGQLWKVRNSCNQ